MNEQERLERKQWYFKRIEDRYKRKVMAHPEGAVVHFGDCSLFDAELGICTCGLHRDLMPMSVDDIEEIYPAFFAETEKIYEVKILVRSHQIGELYEKDEDGGFKKFVIPPPLTPEQIDELLREHFKRKSDE